MKIASILSTMMNGRSHSQANDTSPKAASMVAKPKQPLNGYNLFFYNERQRILSGTDHLPLVLTKARVLEISLAARQGKSNKRAHRKVHGKISFRELASVIGKRWKALGDANRKLLEAQAVLEKERYVEDLHIWNQQEAMKVYHEQQRHRSQTQFTSFHDDAGTRSGDRGFTFPSSAALLPTTEETSRPPIQEVMMVARSSSTPSPSPMNMICDHEVIVYDGAVGDFVVSSSTMGQNDKIQQHPNGTGAPTYDQQEQGQRRMPFVHPHEDSGGEYGNHGVSPPSKSVKIRQHMLLSSPRPVLVTSSSSASSSPSAIRRTKSVQNFLEFATGQHAIAAGYGKEFSGYHPLRQHVGEEDHKTVFLDSSSSGAKHTKMSTQESWFVDPSTLDLLRTLEPHEMETLFDE